MRKILIAIMLLSGSAADAQVLWFQGSGPGGAGTNYMGGQFNNCFNCGMTASPPWYGHPMYGQRYAPPLPPVYGYGRGRGYYGGW